MRQDRINRRRLRGRHHDHPERGFRRMRHGDVRAALLLALQEGPAHGYELGQRLERASNGAWRPSPGSIYPTLQALSDEELVTAVDRDGKRIYELNRRGLAELEERAERGDETPWQAASDSPSSDLKEAVLALKLAAKQVGAIGTAEQVAHATSIVVAARRQVYELLAKS
ncbi:MAG TPA: PadR family transcriptional regulator [Kofleriaceae bacterium]|nr:PadR family transcriptional regulator [Kofleriaceae bacterium]